MIKTHTKTHTHTHSHTHTHTHTQCCYHINVTFTQPRTVGGRGWTELVRKMRRCKDIFEKQAVWFSESKRERDRETEREEGELLKGCTVQWAACGLDWVSSSSRKHINSLYS